MANTTKTLQQLLGHYDSDELVVPEIQRDFVWDKRNVLMLFDSLYRQLPIGSMLVWKAKKEVPVKPGVKLKLNTFYGYLLDGQQRLTAIKYIRDNDEKYPLLFSLKPVNKTDKHQNRFEYLSSKNKNNPWFVPVSEVLRDGFYAYAYLKDLEEKIGKEKIKISNEEDNSLTRLHHILNYNVSINEFEDDNYSTATELFIRFNSTGKKLNRNDLISAELALKVPELVSKKIKIFAGKYDNFPFTMSFLMQCLTAVHTGKMKFKKAEEIWAGGNKKNIRKSWDKTAKAIDRMINFLTGTIKWHSNQWIPSMNALVPLIYIFSTQLLNATDRELARKWLLLATVNAYFSGSVHSTLDSILRKLAKTKDSKMKILWNITKKDLQELTAEYFKVQKQSGAMMSLYLSMLRNKNAKDWAASKNHLNGNVQGHNATLEIHHIFPKDLLRQGGYSYVDINTFANYAIISKEANLAISNEEPKKYLLKNDGQIKINKRDIKDQCIPDNKELWSIKKYKKFIKERRKLLTTSMNEYLR